jgi:hypothetical protein
MGRPLFATLACVLFLHSGLPAAAQPRPNPAMTAPDQLSWQLFIQVNSRAGATNATFETWASDTGTFQMTPQFPATAVPPSLRAPILARIAQPGARTSGMLRPALAPIGQNVFEETRRNRASFDFIVQNNLFKLSGLIAAFGKTISFPMESIEIKANWVPVSGIPAFTSNRVTVAEVPNLYHVTTANDVQYALVAMHVISKLVPNWTWATFEHRFNPARCDVIGCKDAFGAQTAMVPPNPTEGQGYPDCAKTTALAAQLASADIDPVYANYCLKGSQVDFVDNVGLAIRLGNSVTEAGFVGSSSCMTCHGRAAFGKDGFDVTIGGGVLGMFPTVGPLGPLLPSWYFKNTGQPPVFEGKEGLVQTATSADFVWSVAACIIDDLTNPPQQSGCAGK